LNFSGAALLSGKGIVRIELPGIVRLAMMVGMSVDVGSKIMWISFKQMDI
jgi:hypothetical protein